MSHTEGDLSMSRAHVLANAVKLCVAGTLLLLSAVASAQPYPSYLLDTLPVYGPDADDSHFPRIACDDSQAIVMWRGEGQRACRLGDELTVLDTLSINVSGPIPGRSAHAIAGSGTGYLAVWDAEDPDSQDFCLAAALLSRRGEVARRFRIAGDATPLERPAVAFDGENYLVLWEEYWDYATCIKYTRVSQSGVVLDPPRRLRPAGMQTLADVHFATGVYFVSYTELYGPPFTSDVCFSTIRPDGTVVDTTRRVLRPGASASSVAWTGSRFLVVSVDADTSLMTAARISPDGTVLDTGVVVAHEPRMGEPAVACHRDTALVAWCSSDGVSYGYVQCCRLDSLAQPLDSVPLLLSDTAFCDRPVDVVSFNNGFTISWAWRLSRNYDIVARRVTTSGVLVESVPTGISLGANRQYNCDVASDGTNFLAVWLDECDAALPHQAELRGALLSPVSGPLGVSFRIAGPHLLESSVAFGGGCYLVAWFGEDRSLYASRVSTEGGVLDSTPILVVSQQSGGCCPDVAYCDGRFLLVWQGAARTLGARISPSGELLDSVPICVQTNSGSPERMPQVTSDGRAFVVTKFGSWAYPQWVGTVRVDTGGALLDTATNLIAPTAARVVTPFTVTWGNWRYLVTDANLPRNAYLLTSAGARVGDSISLLLAFSGYTGLPSDGFAVTYDSINFVVVAAHPRVGRRWAGAVAVRITEDGTLLDTMAREISHVDGIWRVENHAIGSDSRGTCAFVFFTYESTRYVTSRLRVVTFPRLVGGFAEVPGAQPAVGRVTATPNPNCGCFEVMWAGPVPDVPAVDIYDAAGRKCLSAAVPGQASPGRASCRVDMTRFAPGVYFVRPRGEAALKVTINRR